MQEYCKAQKQLGVLLTGRSMSIRWWLLRQYRSTCQFYAGYTNNESDNIDHIERKPEDVRAVDAYTGTGDTRTRTSMPHHDHHWLPLGAPLRRRSLCKTANVSFAPCPATPDHLSGYLGSMYTFTKIAVLQENPEDFTYYTPPQPVHHSIDTFTNERT